MLICSCRKREQGWIVAMNGWKTLTDMEVNADSIKLIEQYCSELLIHAADVEGLCQGIDEELVKGEFGKHRETRLGPAALASMNQYELTCSSRFLGLDSVHLCGRREGTRRPRPCRPAVERQGRSHVRLGAGHFRRKGSQV